MEPTLAERKRVCCAIVRLIAGHRRLSFRPHRRSMPFGNEDDAYRHFAGGDEQEGDNN